MSEMNTVYSTFLLSFKIIFETSSIYRSEGWKRSQRRDTVRHMGPSVSLGDIHPNRHHETLMNTSDLN